MRRRNNIQAFVLGVGLALAGGFAQAQAPTRAPTIDHGLYLGGAVGQAKVWEFQCEGLPECNQRSSVAKYFAGYQFARHWSAELGFTDLGKIHDAVPGVFNQDIKIRLAEATVVGSYPLTGRMMLYGKAGAYYAKTTDDFTLNGVASRVAENNWGATWGLGLQYYLVGGLAVRVEAQRYMKVGQGNLGDTDIDAVTLGLLYKF